MTLQNLWSKCGRKLPVVIEIGQCVYAKSALSLLVLLDFHSEHSFTFIISSPNSSVVSFLDFPFNRFNP